MNITEKTINKLELDYGICFYDDSINLVETPKHASSIHISWIMQDGEPFEWVGKTIRTPKKMEVTYEWILQKINKENVFVNFCDKFNTFLKTKGLRGYATSYGIGIESLFVGSKNLKENQTSIENELNSLGIKYTTEFSDAYWVFRYRISQSKDNIKKLTKAIK